MKFVMAAVAVGLCAGCASVTQGTTHPLRIETETAKGEIIEGAECTLANDQGTTVANSGTSTLVRRSSKDLDITCSSAGQPDASGRLVSRANAGMAGNILAGGAIGALVDHNSGAAYTYPTWVRLVFGEFAVLDRKDEREGMVLSASPGSATTVKSAGGAPLQASAAPPGAPAAAPEPRLQPAAFTTTLVNGQVLDYQLADRASNRTSPIMLRVDRIGPREVLFNNGARTEGRGGEAAGAGKGLLGELDNVTPPGGWLVNGKVPRGMWPVKFTTTAAGPRTSYDLMATSSPEFNMRTPAGPFRAVRIDLEGWVERGNATARARYKATVWMASELQRPIRFEAKARTAGNIGSAFFEIDEILELTAVSSPRM